MVSCTAKNYDDRQIGYEPAFGQFARKTIRNMKASAELTEKQRQLFSEQGFIVVPGLCPAQLLAQLKAIAEQFIDERKEPLELEAVLGYPGAPVSLNAEGGNTLRRVRAVYQRDPLIQHWAAQGPMAACLQQLFNDNRVFLNTVHHNCLMTKYPSFSSDTGWHQDVRYWQFEQPSLISAWLALTEEHANNGALRVIPGSHRQAYTKEQFDENRFFRTDLLQNQADLARAVQLQLQPGDVLFFSSQLLHKATRNHSDSVKLSLVFTYHDSKNRPIAGSKSSQGASPKLAIDVETGAMADELMIDIGLPSVP